MTEPIIAPLETVSGVSGSALKPVKDCNLEYSDKVVSYYQIVEHIYFFVLTFTLMSPSGAQSTEQCHYCSIVVCYKF